MEKKMLVNELCLLYMHKKKKKKKNSFYPSVGVCGEVLARDCPANPRSTKGLLLHLCELASRINLEQNDPNFFV
jgi:hypothetical protein